MSRRSERGARFTTLYYQAGVTLTCRAARADRLDARDRSHRHVHQVRQESRAIYDVRMRMGDDWRVMDGHVMIATLISTPASLLPFLGTPPQRRSEIGSFSSAISMVSIGKQRKSMTCPAHVPYAPHKIAFPFPCDPLIP